MAVTALDTEQLLELNIRLATEHDSDELLRAMLNIGMDLTSCDGGTLYLLEEGALRFHLMITRSRSISKGGHGETVDLPPVPLKEENVCAWTAIHKQIVNIPDVYESERFDFHGPRRYDAMTGYRTESMLVVPLTDDREDVIGVLQFINALDAGGRVVPFDERFNRIIYALGCQAATRLTNLRYSRELTELLQSFVQVMSTAIDARTPYNANHTRNMALYAERFLDWLRESGNPIAMDEQTEEEFLMAVWLHDVGKLVIPLAVMDKPTRLGEKEQRITARWRIMRLLNTLHAATGESTSAETAETAAALDAGEHLIREINGASILQDDKLAALRALGARRFVDENGVSRPWLEPDELEALSVRKGTLTAKERETMRSHVVYTAKLLSQIKFTGGYRHVPVWAGDHHEFLDGTGYPAHKTADELPMPVRLLTILDIFDALTAKDRPYKKGLPVERALEILATMADEGQLDRSILALFEQSRAWESAKEYDKSEGGDG